MIGKILTVSDAKGEVYVEDAREAWQQQGFLLDSTDIVTALKEKRLDKYHMIALTMNQDNSALFREYIKPLRAQTKIPIVLFPYTEEAKQDVLTTLLEGATQIMALPIDMDWAIMNCLALIRQYVGTEPCGTEPLTMYTDYKIFLNVSRYSAHVDGKRIELSKTEFDLLRLLMEHRGNYLSHTQIYRHVWGEAYTDTAPNVLHNQIKNLRKRIQWKDALPQYIRTKRGVGYSFSPQFDVQESA